MSLISRRYVLAAATAIALVACGEKPKPDAPADAPTPPAPAVNPVGAAADPATTKFAASLDIDLSKFTKTASGLYYRDLKVGSGARADSGKSVSVHYTGYLADGTMFETSTTSAPIGFSLGTGQVVQGWDQGIPGMKVGGKRQLVIPSALGYGDAGSGKIPGGSVMIFNVELMDVAK